MFAVCEIEAHQQDRGSQETQYNHIMAHFDKHSKSITALVDVSEAMLNAMEEHGIDPETVANRNEFTVMVHFLKSIIDGELNIPNELTDRIRDTAFQIDMDQKINKKLN